MNAILRPKTIAVCVSLKDESEMEELKHLANSNLFENADIHLVHVFKKNLYFNELTPYNFPDESNFETIESTVQEILANFSKNIIPQSSLSKVTCHCLLNTDPKQRLVTFLTDIKADLVISSIRQNHGIEGVFTSSFTEYLCKFAPCDVYVVKHRLGLAKNLTL